MDESVMEVARKVRAVEADALRFGDQREHCSQAARCEQRLFTASGRASALLRPRAACPRSGKRCLRRGAVLVEGAGARISAAERGTGDGPESVE